MSIRSTFLSRPWLVAASLAVAALPSVHAQQSGTATASASATIITPISISKTSDLVFGNLAVGATGGTVAISAGDVVTIGGGGNTITQPVTSKGSPLAAVFAVAGTANFTYAITLPADGTVTIADGGGHTMAVNGFVSNPGLTGTLSAGGTETLKVGATLSVGNNQTPGAYTGSFSVTVAYN